MIRQIFRFSLRLLIFLKKLVCKYPGFFIGGVVGFVLSEWMVKYGFPKWIVPVQTLMWAVAVAPIVKTYLDRLK